MIGILHSRIFSFLFFLVFKFLDCVHKPNLVEIYYILFTTDILSKLLIFLSAY